MTKFVKGYKNDAAVDIVLKHPLVIQPGFQEIELNVKFTPGEGEVAFLIARGSTAAKGILPIGVAIDTGYTGNITAWVFNASGMKHEFKTGERVFSIVNLQLGSDRVEFTVSKEGERGSNKKGSSNTPMFTQLSMFEEE